MSEFQVVNGSSGRGAMHKTAALRYLDELFRYAMVLTRNQTDAEDLVQETYVRGLKAIGSLQPDSNLKSWLFTILPNIWLNQLRQVRAAPRIIELDTDEGTADLAVATSKDPHALYVEAQERDLVREAILLLPLEFREIILLREYEEFSYQEISKLLDCPAGTVMSRLARAVQTPGTFVKYLASTCPCATPGGFGMNACRVCRLGISHSRRTHTANKQGMSGRSSRLLKKSGIL